MTKNALDVLACPECKGKVELSGLYLVCRKCNMAYSVIDDIPDMLIEDAKKLKDAA